MAINMQTPTIRPPKARSMSVVDGAATGESPASPVASRVSDVGRRFGDMVVSEPNRKAGVEQAGNPAARFQSQSTPLRIDPRWTRVDDQAREANPYRSDGGREFTPAPTIRTPPPRGPGITRFDPNAREADAWRTDRPQWEPTRSEAPRAADPSGEWWYQPTERIGIYEHEPGSIRPDYIEGPDPYAGARDPTEIAGFSGEAVDPFAGRPALQQMAGYRDPGVANTGLRSDLDRFAREGLRTPSRFDLDMVRRGTDLIDSELAAQGERARRDLDEFASARGLVGSNVELEEQRRLGEGLEDQRMRRLMDLNLAMANTHAADRAAAGGIASQIQGAQQQESQFGRSLGQQESQFARQHGLDETRFLESQRQFSTAMQEQITAREQQETQFARAHGLNVDQFRENQRQYSVSMAEQIATRMQQENQFARGLDLQHTQLAIQSQLQTRSMDLQEKGMHMDDAFRRAELDVTSELQTRALDLQEQGMNMDDAYRYAALEQDGSFRQRALDLEQQGLSLEESLRGAELDFRQWATTEQMEQDRWQSNEASRLAELDILIRGLGMGLDVELPGRTIHDPENPGWHPPMVPPNDPNTPPNTPRGGGPDPEDFQRYRRFQTVR